jgi:hypothetical protein
MKFAKCPHGRVSADVQQVKFNGPLEGAKMGDFLPLIKQEVDHLLNQFTNDIFLLSFLALFSIQRGYYLGTAAKNLYLQQTH